MKLKNLNYKSFWKKLEKLERIMKHSFRFELVTVNLIYRPSQEFLIGILLQLKVINNILLYINEN